jgi:hypothetical protein
MNVALFVLLAMAATAVEPGQFIFDIFEDQEVARGMFRAGGRVLQRGRCWTTESIRETLSNWKDWLLPSDSQVR